MSRSLALAMPAERAISHGASLLALSVLADSATEHYRGSFRNKAMVLPLATSALALAANLLRLGGAAARGVHGAAVATGMAGFGFHAWNVGKQPGGFRLTNLFYKAPLGAPGALVLTGVLSAMADAVRSRPASLVGRLLRRPRAIAAVTAFGLAGTVAEVGLLHFRGAFHDPAMWLPVSIPPVAAISLAIDVARAVPGPQTAPLLAATAVLGLVGVGFHAWGVARNMGGWRNWRQNLLAGPPIPAPPSFTGLAVAGLGALRLLGRGRRA